MQTMQTAEVVPIKQAAKITDTSVRDLFRTLNREEITLRNILIRLRVTQDDVVRVRVIQQFNGLERQGFIKQLKPGSERYRAIQGI